MKERMCNLIWFALIGMKKVNWKKVEKVYEKKDIAEVKKWREVFGVD